MICYSYYIHMDRLNDIRLLKILRYKEIKKEILILLFCPLAELVDSELTAHCLT